MKKEIVHNVEVHPYKFKYIFLGDCKWKGEMAYPNGDVIYPPVLESDLSDIAFNALKASQITAKFANAMVNF